MTDLNAGRSTYNGEGGLRSILSQILDLQRHYSSSNTPEMQTRGNLIREAGPDRIREMLPETTPSGLAVEGRDGTGLKTRVPWMRVYSHSNSPTATEGWYVVYLFAFDGSSVYLSLNQGTTTFVSGQFVPKPASEITTNVQEARSLLGTLNEPRLTHSISLHDPGTLGPGYEKGNVFAYTYDAARIPADAQLRDDLHRLLELLFRLYGSTHNLKSRVDSGQSVIRHGTGQAGVLTAAGVQQEAALRGLRLDDSVIRSLVAALDSGKHVMLTGPPGTGKTTLAEAAASAGRLAGLCADFVMTTATSDWTTYETVGGLHPTMDGGLAFRRGQFLQAIIDDKWLIVDELNRSNFDRAFGQLFTVLSGQTVELPYTDPETGAPVRIVPELHRGTQAPGEITVSASWRIIATINVFDKALLYEMSYALMRRFAFVEVPAPAEEVYVDLIRGIGGDELLEIMSPLLGLRTIRELGPATFLDAARYVRSRLDSGTAELGRLIYDTFYAFLLPQFEGIDEADAGRLYRTLEPLVKAEASGRLRVALQDVLGVRVRLRPTSPVTEDGE